MIHKILELTNGINWGKFLVAQFEESEWKRRSQVDTVSGVPLLRQCGWTPGHLWVLDLQTGEGAGFRPGGSAEADLEKHAIHVCPMFPVFLGWLYKHPECWSLESLPEIVTLTDDETMAASALYGRRHGACAR